MGFQANASCHTHQSTTPNSKLVLAVFGVAGTAHAAPKHTTPTTKHGQIQPFSTGGGCYDTNYSSPPEHDGACISSNSNGYVAPDGYVYAQSGVSTGWTYCSATVYLWEYTTSWVLDGSTTWNCLYDFQHLIVDHITTNQVPCTPGYQFQTQVDLTTTWNGNQYYVSQDSPQLFC